MVFQAPFREVVRRRSDWIHLIRWLHGDIPFSGMANESETPTQATVEEQELTTENDETVEGPREELAEALAAIELAKKEKQELLDQYQRAQAEFDNARKRLLKEQDDTRKYAAMSTIEAMLPIVDDFERALDVEDIDAELRKGLDLIHSRILDAFVRAGLEPIDESGKFDPNFHEAVDSGPAERDEDDQKILEVYRRGYRFRDRVLRASMVKVAVKQ